jgi:hypothetical protein
MLYSYISVNDGIFRVEPTALTSENAELCAWCDHTTLHAHSIKTAQAKTRAFMACLGLVALWFGGLVVWWFGVGGGTLGLVGGSGGGLNGLCTVWQIYIRHINYIVCTVIYYHNCIHGAVDCANT